MHDIREWRKNTRRDLNPNALKKPNKIKEKITLSSTCLQTLIQQFILSPYQTQFFERGKNMNFQFVVFQDKKSIAGFTDFIIAYNYKDLINSMYHAAHYKDRFRVENIFKKNN